jgi:hypothetical protein
LTKLWSIIKTNFVAKEDGKGLFSGSYADLTGTPTKLTDFTNDLGLDNTYLKSSDAATTYLTKDDAGTTYVAKSDYDTKVAALEQADTDNLATAKKYTDDTVGALTGFDFQIVDALPTSGVKGIIYLVPAAEGDNVSADDNVYNEYIWITSGDGETATSQFELLGTTKMDLTGYLKEVDITVITNDDIDSICTMTDSASETEANA